MDLISQLRSAIVAQSLPTPSTAFLTTLATARNPPPPIPSLVATAKARLLASDLTNSSSNSIVDSSLPTLPQGIENVTTKETKLPRDVFLQVVDIENISLSRWEQVEELEAIERGERTRGRQVIRVAAQDDDGNDISSGQTQTQTQMQTQRGNASSSTGPTTSPNALHRLVLQDRSGKRIFAIELKRISGIAIGKTHIGEKILLRAGSVVARGTVLLTPETCVLLGGKIEAWHDGWLEGRLPRLREAAGADRPS